MLDSTATASFIEIGSSFTSLPPPPSSGDGSASALNSRRSAVLTTYILRQRSSSLLGRDFSPLVRYISSAACGFFILVHPGKPASFSCR